MDNDKQIFECIVLFPLNKDFCNSKDEFISFLNMSSLMIFHKTKIQYRSNDEDEKISIKYDIASGVTIDENERFFHIKFESQVDVSIKLFMAFIRHFKKAIEKINGGDVNINILVDTSKNNLAVLGYPLIVKLENIFRSLLSKFFLTKIGSDWHKTYASGDVINKMKRNVEKFDDATYNLDFIQLTSLLFDKYRSMSINEIDSIISGGENEISREEISNFLPKSNWERYFTDIVEEDEKNILRKWESLYVIRNKIAHSRGISLSEYSKLENDYEYLKAVFIKASLKIDTIEISKAQEKSIIEHKNYIVNDSEMDNEKYKRYLNTGNMILDSILLFSKASEAYKLANSAAIASGNISKSEMLANLSKAKFIESYPLLRSNEMKEYVKNLEEEE